MVLEYRRPVIRDKRRSTLMEVPAPSAVFDNSLADVSLLAGVLVDKFLYHLPLYRQHQRLADAGITLSRATLTNYVRRAIGLLEPIYDAQWQHILQSRVLAMDETPIKAGKAGKGKLKTSWYWPVYGEDDEICFTWSTSRGSAHVKQQLGEFAGTLLSDGCAAYDTYAKARAQVTQAQCWAHTRRYFERAQGSDPAAAQALELMFEKLTASAIFRGESVEGTLGTATGSGSFLAELLQRDCPVRVAERPADVGGPLEPFVESSLARMAGRGRVLIRPSGTEPLIRVMVEAETDAEARMEADGLVAAVQSLFG